MKKYTFDYLREDVEQWQDKKHITRQQLNMLPWRIQLPYWDLITYIPSMDYYGDVIDDPYEWHRQRNEYLDNLWLDLGGYSDES